MAYQLVRARGADTERPTDTRFSSRTYTHTLMSTHTHTLMSTHTHTHTADEHTHTH